MSKVFKFNRDINILKINIEDKEYIVNLENAPDFSPKLIKLGTEMGKVKENDEDSMNKFIDSSKEGIDLLLGEGSFDEIFTDIPKQPAYIIQLLNYILDEVNKFNEKRFATKYNV